MERRSYGAAYTAALLVGVCAARALAQVEAPSASGPVFDVVSVKRNTEKGPFGRPLNPSVRRRPDGGITMISVPVSTIIIRAYELPSPRLISGLPSWVAYEPYDVVATSTLERATSVEHRAMLRAMLADRFKLQAHTARGVDDVHELVLERADGRLGPGLVKIDADCAPIEAARMDAIVNAEETGVPVPRPRPVAPGEALPPCQVHGMSPNSQTPDYRGDRMYGEGTMQQIADFLRLSTGGPVIDRTGLQGSYRVSLTYGMFALRRGPSVDPATDVAPSVLVALPEQLGLKLRRAKAEHDVLVVDRIERPSEN